MLREQRQREPPHRAFAVDAIEKVAKHLPSSPRTARTSNPAATSPTPRISCAGSRSPSCAPPPTTSSRRPSAGSSPTCRTGASLLLIADATIRRSARCCPRNSTPSAKSWAKRRPRQARLRFVTALAKLMERTGMDKLAMSDFNINKDDLPRWPISPPPKSGSSATATPSRKRTWSKS